MEGVQPVIEACSLADRAVWSRMRHCLWPEASLEEHDLETFALLGQPERYAVFLAKDVRGNPAGFVEASLRHDYVNGTRTSPVAFVEGLYTVESMRRQGVARLLMEAVVKWAKTQGCTELASDALLENEASHLAHKSLGFEETERVVYFRKAL